MFVLLTSDETISKSLDFVSFASLICKIWIINYSVESQYRLGMIQNRTVGENGRIKSYFHSTEKGRGNKNRRGKLFYMPKNFARGSTYEASTTLEKEVNNFKYLFEL